MDSTPASPVIMINASIHPNSDSAPIMTLWFNESRPQKVHSYKVKDIKYQDQEMTGNYQRCLRHPGSASHQSHSMYFILGS